MSFAERKLHQNRRATPQKSSRPLNGRYCRWNKWLNIGRCCAVSNVGLDLTMTNAGVRSNRSNAQVEDWITKTPSRAPNARRILISPRSLPPSVGTRTSGCFSRDRRFFCRRSRYSRHSGRGTLKLLLRQQASPIHCRRPNKQGEIFELLCRSLFLFDYLLRVL